MNVTKQEDLALLAETAQSFAARELASGREVNDRYPFGPFWSGVLDKAFEVGFLHILLPEEWGGMGREVTPLAAVLRAVSEVDASLAGVLFTHALAQEILLAAGGPAGPQHASPDGLHTVREALLACPAFLNPGETEPGLEAARRGEKHLLSGKMDYLVLGGVAARAVVPARTPGRPGYSFFLADLASAGVAVSDPVLSLGLHACPAVDARFERVPAELLGTEGEGHAAFRDAADRMLAAAASMAAGILQGSFREALAYARQRSQGGRQIVHWPEVRMMLADMAVEARVAEMCAGEACRAVDSGLADWRLSCRAAAIHSLELAVKATTDGVQVLGGVGYMKDFGQEKRFRDAQHIQALLGLAPMKKMDLIASLVEGPEALP